MSWPTDRSGRRAPQGPGAVGAATPDVPRKTKHAAAASTAPHRPKARRHRGKRRG